MGDISDFLLIAEDPSLISVEVEEVHVVGGSEQGPQGITGAVGGAAAQVIAAIAMAPLAGFRVVKGLFGGDGVTYADRTIPTDEWAVIGVTLASANGGGNVQVQSHGEVTNPAWTWVDGPIYLDTAGNLTQVSPTSGFVLRVGFARTATKMFIRLRTL